MFGSLKNRCIFASVINQNNKTMTTENNKLIAEFMELEATPKYNPKEYYVKEYNSGEWYLLEEMKYHSSWDWLMPVAYKILWLEGYEDESYDDIHNGLTNALLSQTYEAVVEFIKEHND